MEILYSVFEGNKFGYLYVVASYIRKHSEAIYQSTSAGFWGIASVGLVILSMLSIVTILYWGVHIGKTLSQYYLIAGSQQTLALLVSVFTFMWVKNLTVPHSKLINILGGCVFGSSAYPLRFIHNDGLAVERHCRLCGAL